METYLKMLAKSHQKNLLRKIFTDNRTSVTEVN